MDLPIERRLKLVGAVSNLMLMGSIHVYGARGKKMRVRVKMPAAGKGTPARHAA